MEFILASDPKSHSHCFHFVPTTSNETISGLPCRLDRGWQWDKYWLWFDRRIYNCISGDRGKLNRFVARLQFYFSNSIRSLPDIIGTALIGG